MNSVAREICNSSLSERETEVLQKLSEGSSTFEVAEEMYIGFETVKTYRRSLLNKLQARNTAHLIRIAFEMRLLKPEHGLSLII